MALKNGSSLTNCDILEKIRSGIRSISVKVEVLEQIHRVVMLRKVQNGGLSYNIDSKEKKSSEPKKGIT